MKVSLGLLLVIASLSSVDSYKFFQARIPNGDKVKHPCVDGQTWGGVGHYNQAGGGVRNAFGTDFHAAGKQWTRALCMKDSDGDGRTNGEELGDPSCVWTVGTTPARTTNISHPGVCEPFNSPGCQARNKDFTSACKSKEFVCNATMEPNVTTIDIRMKHTAVPTKITNYFCQAFALPNDTDQHLIATAPIINNTDVMHHILLYGCNSKPDAKRFLEPYECGMGGTGCGFIIGLWTLGVTGDCFNEHSGVRIGPNGYNFIVMQVHWNNPAMRSDYTDSSGMRFYLTPKLRKYDSTLLTLGQRYLEIQPGHSAFIQEAECSPACSKRLPHSLFLVNVLPHMHYAGRFSEIVLYRNGSKVRDLFPYSQVQYDAPQTITFDQPVEMKPGDRLHLKCVYRTTKVKNTIYYGEATADEMCFAFFRYYPAQQVQKNCLYYGPIDRCTLNDKENGGDGRTSPGRIGNCSNLGAFMGKLYMVWLPMINEHCDISMDVCRPRCKALVKRLNQEPCWQGWAKKYIEFISSLRSASLAYIREIRLAIVPCSMEIAKEEGLKTKPPIKENNAAGLTNQQQTILIGVGAAAVGLLLVTVAAIGLYRAFLAKPASPMGRAYLAEAQVTNNNNKGIDNQAGPAHYEPDGTGTRL